MLQPRSCAAILLGLVLAATSACGPKGTPADTTPSSSFLTPAQVVESVTRAVETWRQAWEVRDMETISPLYAHDLDLVVVVQGQAYLGWSAVETYLTTRINVATSIHVTVDSLQVIALGNGGAAASASVTRDYSDGVTSISDRGILTMALRAVGDEWIIVSEHYSYPPTFE